MTKVSPAVFVAATLALLLPVDARAQITQIDVQVVESPALDGQRFGQIGQYERLRGIAHGEVDPLEPG